ncbi:Platinum sensitivity protein [Recurvomyces mirabilis]|uniref:Platinum sensitivity protein n=1 Tax=Recurvomyces mirabilis TaxID=574656 RepID=A0AAE1C315_9PEZI|nr:Platinum sensitivity protein [Recurvomyces mirabilis]KAK5153853.1 Platinum sensitivity protein [Recurvomyces mirabilis]
MASQSGQSRRVKVYELKNNDWYDRGTGFCSGQVLQPNADNPDGRIVVVSEDDPQRALLETRITKDDGYQKQQDTLIVWTEQNGVDMALSFQEADGCAVIWEFVSEVQQRLSALFAEDGLSDDLLDAQAFVLPEPELGRLEEIEANIRGASMNTHGREALVKYIMNPEHPYILRLAPLVEEAEKQHNAPALHRLCSIMKHLILLNDNSIIEFVVTDQAIMGVVGALEYDPDFPSHRANHRQYLSDSSKFKEVVHIESPEVRKKIHCTYRLLYLKDVVLARILDDPTFSVLNSLIFYHQVEIVTHIQGNQDFLSQLFDLFRDDPQIKPEKKREAVLFIQNCCAVSKNIQAPQRASLYTNFIHHGLFTVIAFALRHHDAAVRVAGTDVLVALIDHDPHLVRSHIFTAMKDQTTPLTDTLIELLLVEVDLGVKSQMADAIKILLDPTSANGMDMMRAGQANSEIMAKRGLTNGASHASPQTEAFIQAFYDGSAKRLFRPLKDLEHRKDMLDLSVHDMSMMTHLVDCLCFFVRQHTWRAKAFILGENLHSRVAQLLACPHKFMKLTALKWFRTCIGLQDEFHNRHMIQHRLFEPMLDVVYETMPRDNLLNSSCLELFEFIKRETVKQLIMHLAEQYRDRLLGITYVNTFQQLVLKYDQMQAGYVPAANGIEDSSFTTQEGTPARIVNGTRFAGLKDMDGDEEAYFNGDDDAEDDDDIGLPTALKAGLTNGASPVRPLVDYPDDEDEELGPMDGMELLASSPDRDVLVKERKSHVAGADPHETAEMDFFEDDPRRTSPEQTSDRSRDRERGRDRRPVPVEGSPGRQGSPPEPLASKRRRDDEDDDELGKMMGGIKRRNSSAASVTSQTGRSQVDGPTKTSPLVKSSGSPVQQHPVGGSQPMLRRKGSLKTKNESSGLGKFAIKTFNFGTKQQQQHDDETTNGDAHLPESEEGSGEGTTVEAVKENGG